MNEQIKELATLVGILAIPLHRVGTAEEHNAKLEKFAKLVAARCANLCTDDYHTIDGWGLTSADWRCANVINEHFGLDD